MKTRIHLVRHALSEANLDLEMNRRKPDHAIELAEQGVEQAKKAGKFLADHIAGIGKNSTGGFHHRRVRMLVSPYLRTRQTADGLAEGLKRRGIEFDTRESLALREQSFGLFDGLRDDELPLRYPDHHAHYEKHSEFQGEFFAPMPMGESRAMVTDRVRGVFGTILRDMSGRNGPPVTDMIVVSHGVTIRCFRLGWFQGKRTWEWCEREPNPWNCSVTTIEGRQGKGWIETQTYEGFEHRKETIQDRREEGHVAHEAPIDGTPGAQA